jgi:tetratricopeptide (TPR) repeat protein
MVWWKGLHVHQIEEQLAAGNAAEALAAAENYLANHPEHSEVHALRARALVALGRVEEARQLFEQVGAAQPVDLRAWSHALLTLGEWQQALPILARLDQMDPTNHETLEAITVCQYELGRHGEAIASAQRLAELPGHEAAGHLQLASIYRSAGQATLANQHFETVLQYHPDARGLDIDPAEFFLAYGECSLLSGDARRALELIERSHQLKPSSRALLGQGEAWQAIGNVDRARQVLNQIAQHDPERDLARERLAEIALHQNDPTSALQNLQSVQERGAITANSAYLLQRAYTALGEESLAEQWQARTAALRHVDRQLAALRREVRPNPDSPRARLVTAYQSAVNRDWTTAGRSLAALLRQAPDAYAEPFVQQLAEAIRQRGELPPLETMPDKTWKPANER